MYVLQMEMGKKERKLQTEGRDRLCGKCRTVLALYMRGANEALLLGGVGVGMVVCVGGEQVLKEH